MWGLFPLCLTTCQWLVSLPAGVLVVLGIRGWVLWCVLAHSRWLLAGAWTPWLCRASTWGVICLGVSGLWVHGWICSGVDGCWRGLWAHRCSTLGLLHCGCWVIPQGLSPALLWGVVVVPGVVLLGFLCSGGPLDVCGLDSDVQIQVLTDTQMFYTELHLPLNISCIHKYCALFSKRAGNMNVSAGVDASRVLSCILFILLSFFHSIVLLSPSFLLPLSLFRASFFSFSFLSPCP
ncbi:hypothetical protein GOODEAATRI_032078 [Goodea atripinnis]|uniref:Uncharacterized protein n=1 Tax=Goodea atripinnis TaxID=208336 RepID=A0ABV0MMF3_9TELE